MRRFENFDFSAIFGPGKVKILVKMAIFDFRMAINGRKIKIFKIAAYTFCIILQSSPDIKTSLPSAPSFHIFVVLGEQWVFFSLYGISIGFRDPDFTLSAIK